MKTMLVRSLSMTLMKYLPLDCMICGCQDPDHTQKLRKLILNRLCKIHFTNLSTNFTEAAQEKPKFHSLPAFRKVRKNFRNVIYGDISKITETVSRKYAISSKVAYINEQSWFGTCGPLHDNKVKQL